MERRCDRWGWSATEACGWWREWIFFTFPTQSILSGWLRQLNWRRTGQVQLLVTNIVQQCLEVWVLQTLSSSQQVCLIYRAFENARDWLCKKQPGWPWASRQKLFHFVLWVWNSVYFLFHFSSIVHKSQFFS